MTDIKRMTVSEYDELLALFKETHGLTGDSVMPFPPSPIDEIEGMLTTRRNDLVEDIFCTAEFSNWEENVGDEESWSNNDYSSAKAQTGEQLNDLIDNPLIPQPDKDMYLAWTKKMIEERQKMLQDLVNLEGITITNVSTF
jgi:hypothetical protein